MTNEGHAPTNDGVRAIWDANAGFWDERMGEGNSFHLHLVGPAAERLLALQPGERVVELACGNGQFSRRMAELGATVLATDLSERMIERARAHTADRPDLDRRITFAHLDAADPAALAALAGAPFDAGVCNMAIMDMVAIEPLFRALPSLLRPHGRFVFTIMHPVLNNPGGTNLCAEESDRGGDLVTEHSIRVVRYRTTGATKGLAMAGQPVAQWYVHRTLAELLGAAFAAGLVMDGIDEPYLPPDPDAAPLAWSRFQEIPPVLGVRLRVPGR
jgi:SAM-dependent methyltransferase